MFNWREIPFVRLLVSLVAGITASVCFSWNHSLLWAVVCLFPVLLRLAQQLRGMYRHRWLFGALMHFFLFLLGYQVTWYVDEIHSPAHFDRLLDGEEKLVMGEVSDAPVRKGEWVRVKLDVKGMGTISDSLVTACGNLLLYVARDAASNSISYGDRVYFSGRPTRVAAPMNPHAFDFRRYLRFQHIHHQAFVREGNWVLLEHGKDTGITGMAIKWQERLLQSLRRHLPHDREFSVAAALILGHRDEIQDEVREAYSRTGAMHVLAVSGLHVGIVFLIFNFFLKKVRLNTVCWRVIKMLILLAAIWSFALITGGSPSVIRAAVMFSFLNAGLAFQRYSSIYNTLAASAFCMLLWDPYLLFSVSFQLSYLAVFGIVYFQPKFSRLWVIKHSFLHKIWELVCVSLAAQLMTLPVTFFYFHQFPVYFWLSSLVLVPLAGIELGTGLLLLLLDACWGWGAAATGFVLNGMFWLGNECVEWIQQLPFALWEGIWITGLTMGLLYLVIASSMMAIGSRRFRWVLCGLFFLLVASIEHAFTEFQHLKNRQMVVYQVYGHTAIDLFDGEDVFCWRNKALEEKSLSFAAENHRLAMGGKGLVSHYLEDTTSHLYRNCFFEKGYVQFYNTRFAVIRDSEALSFPGKMEVDYVIISSNPGIRMKELVDKFSFEKIVFDASNKKWQVAKWVKVCEVLGVPYHNVHEEGAFLYNINYTQRR